MISENELRIGNYVSKYVNHIRCVTGVCVDGTVYLTNKENCETCMSEYTIDELFPIPITEEWLVKAGFEFINSERLRHNEFKTLIAFKHVFKSGFGIVLKDFHALPNVKHVHQLQNLYFALTGEELKFKEDEKPTTPAPPKDRDISDGKKPRKPQV